MQFVLAADQMAKNQQVVFQLPAGALTEGFQVWHLFSTNIISNGFQLVPGQNMQIVQFSESGGFLTTPVIQKNDQTFGKIWRNVF